jgi:hypothetical protein
MGDTLDDDFNLDAEPLPPPPPRPAKRKGDDGGRALPPPPSTPGAVGVGGKKVRVCE